jgi:hypothetical protein
MLSSQISYNMIVLFIGRHSFRYMPCKMETCYASITQLFHEISGTGLIVRYFAAISYVGKVDKSVIQPIIRDST